MIDKKSQLFINGKDTDVSITIQSPSIEHIYKSITTELKKELSYYIALRCCCFNINDAFALCVDYKVDYIKNIADEFGVKEKVYLLIEQDGARVRATFSPIIIKMEFKLEPARIIKIKG